MLHIRLTENCNFKCVFCHIPQLKPKNLTFLDVLKIIVSIDCSSPQTFCISGGEPTSVPYFLKLVKFIKKRNKDNHINIETNGFFLSNYNYTKSIVDAGVNSILLSFHSHIPEVFDKITGIKGSFSFLEKTMSILNQLPVNVEVSIVLCKYNYTDLLGTILYLNKHLNYKGILISNIFEKINYSKLEGFHLPIHDISSYLREAYDLLKSSGKEINSCGIPMCYLNGYEDTYYVGQYDEGRYYKKSEVCRNCVLNDVCRGLIGDYADMYGTDFLTPVENMNVDMLKKLTFMKNEYVYSENLKINNSDKIGIEC